MRALARCHLLCLLSAGCLRLGFGEESNAIQASDAGTGYPGDGQTETGQLSDGGLPRLDGPGLDLALRAEGGANVPDTAGLWAPKGVENQLSEALCCKQGP